MEEQNPVYIRLKYSESLESKRDILFLEMSLLNMMKTLRRYNSLREKELEMKSEIGSKIKGINAEMKKAKSSFPSVKSPQKPKKEEQARKEIKTLKENSNDDIESQLLEIQEKLRAISG